MTFSELFNKSKVKFQKFWKSENSKISLIRDILIALLLVLIILTALWAYTGQWFGAPMVAIESGSMQHRDEPYGRYGTINAGDMVFLVKTHVKSDIVTNIEKDSNNFYYGKYGDVIVYMPYGDKDRDQIIHRAMCWVEYNEEDQTYNVKGYNLSHVKSITIPELGLSNYKSNPPHSGYITKGDNPDTNPTCDQGSGGICDEPIKFEWVSGKARGELPWIGTLNLFFNDITQGKSTVANVPQDCIVCLIILIIILISIPVALDLYSYIKEKKKKNNSN
jgi:signal peptidase